MKCPACGATVPEGALSCPACHASLDVTREISLQDATWCPGCGALVAPGASTCPRCGSSLDADNEPTRQVRDLDLPEIGNTGMMDALGDDAGATGVMTRIESAIPSADDDSSPAARHDRAPRPRSFALAALFAVLVVGGAVLLITHPWDPTASQTKATEPADTSMSGFPGFLQSLTGQDETAAPETQEPVDPLEALTSAYDELATLSERADASEAALRDVGTSGSAEEREKGLDEAQALSIEVSNHITACSALSDADGAYAEDIEHLLTLGNWVRNRCDALTRSWGISVDAQDPAASASEICASVDAASDYAELFEENFDAWRPSQG